MAYAGGSSRPTAKIMARQGVIRYVHQKVSRGVRRQGTSPRATGATVRRSAAQPATVAAGVRLL